MCHFCLPHYLLYYFYKHSTSTSPSYISCIHRFYVAFRVFTTVTLFFLHRTDECRCHFPLHILRLLVLQTANNSLITYIIYREYHSRIPPRPIWRQERKLTRAGHQGPISRTARQQAAECDWQYNVLSLVSPRFERLLFEGQVVDRLVYCRRCQCCVGKDKKSAPKHVKHDVECWSRDIQLVGQSYGDIFTVSTISADYFFPFSDLHALVARPTRIAAVSTVPSIPAISPFCLFFSAIGC